MKRLASFALILGLAACAAPPSSRSTVAASQVALTAAGRVVLACYSLPSCSSVAPKAQIRTAYDQAYTALVAAQATADAGGTPSMTAAAAAMATLQGLIAPLPTS